MPLPRDLLYDRIIHSGKGVHSHSIPDHYKAKKLQGCGVTNYDLEYDRIIHGDKKNSKK